jgi:hypothetical protein
MDNRQEGTYSVWPAAGSNAQRKVSCGPPDARQLLPGTLYSRSRTPTAAIDANVSIRLTLTSQGSQRRAWRCCSRRTSGSFGGEHGNGGAGPNS